MPNAGAPSPRPHGLLTVRAGTASPACRFPFEVERQLARAARAPEFERLGRHAAAERLLRDVEGTLARREAWAAAAATLMTLGRMLLERGRAADAQKVFATAAQRAEAAGTGESALDARLWQAAAWTDANRLTEAESICRGALLHQGLSPGRQAWAQGLLARVLCWQNRAGEALQAGTPRSDASLLDADAIVALSTDATAVRLLLAVGDVFEAGQRSRALLSLADGVGDARAHTIAFTAHLRVLAASGDLHSAGQRLQEICSLARGAHAPLRAVRARLIWHEALRRAGRGREAHQEIARLWRMRRAAPPLLRRAIEERFERAGAPPCTKSPATVTVSPSIATLAAALVHLAHEGEDDSRAVRLVLERAFRELHPSRVDLVSTDAGPVSTVVSIGTGLATRLGQRVLDAGISITDDAAHGGREAGAPVRFSGRLVGAIVGRWPVDRHPPPHAGDVLTLTAAIVAARVDSILMHAREIARTATSVPELVGGSAAMADVRRAIARAAKAPFSVLIEGESGVGKELAARAIHQLGPRRERRFCDVNCAALPDDLLESELFGHARGAFTGAVAETSGLFEEADGGTLLLDEVADLSPRAQAKLLRVVQQQEVRRVGETFARRVDVRLVTAANRDMRTEAAEGRFRPDLLYRLDVIRIRIPALRERPEDIPELAHHFWQGAASRVNSKATLTHGVLAELARYHWPGNVRELQNVMAALAVAAPARGRVGASLLPAAITGAASITSKTLAEARAQFERRCVEAALARAGGSRTRAAAELGLSRQGLLKTMARLGIGISVPGA